VTLGVLSPGLTSRCLVVLSMLGAADTETLPEWPSESAMSAKGTPSTRAIPSAYATERLTACTSVRVSNLRLRISAVQTRSETSPA